MPTQLRTPLLFPSPTGELLDLDNFRRREWSPAIEASGVATPARVYDLRSTFASNALAGGVTVFELARRMGTSVRMREALRDPLRLIRQGVLVERFSFTSDVAFVPRGDLLDHVSMAPLTQPFEEGALVGAAIFRFEPGGRIRRHPGTYPQIIAVLEGSGEVSGRMVSMSRSAQAKRSSRLRMKTMR